MHETVLVIDDSTDIRELIRLILTREGYEVWLAPDGNSAMQLLDHPELASAVCTVVCDLVMPNGSGTDLITYLRKDHPDIPVIVCSGTDDTVFLQGILQDGVCDWMRKPVSRDALVQKVRTTVHLFTLRTQQDKDIKPVPSRLRVATSGVETFHTPENGAT